MCVVSNNQDKIFLTFAGRRPAYLAIFIFIRLKKCVLFFVKACGEARQGAEPLFKNTKIMARCEKCWNDAYTRSLSDTNKSQTEHYFDLLEERKDNPCYRQERIDSDIYVKPVYTGETALSVVHLGTSVPTHSAYKERISQLEEQLKAANQVIIKASGMISTTKPMAVRSLAVWGELNKALEKYNALKTKGK